MLSDVMLSVILLNVIVMIVIAPLFSRNSKLARLPVSANFTQGCKSALRVEHPFGVL
jgi:hypothetical protein